MLFFHLVIRIAILPFVAAWNKCQYNIIRAINGDDADMEIQRQFSAILTSLTSGIGQGLILERVTLDSLLWTLEKYIRHIFTAHTIKQIIIFEIETKAYAFFALKYSFWRRKYPLHQALHEQFDKHLLPWLGWQDFVTPSRSRSVFSLIVLQNSSIPYLITVGSI